MIGTLLFATAAWIETPASQPQSDSFPTEYRGDWYGEPGPCKPENLALQVGATKLNYFDEFSGRLTHVIRQTDRSLDYAAQYSAEGHVWNTTETLTLSPDGHEMTIKPEHTSSRYFRCNEVNGSPK